MGDNIRKIMYWTLPYNAASLTALWHHVDPKHSFVSSFLCIYKLHQQQGTYRASTSMVLETSGTRCVRHMAQI